jgi:hypothetical protein
MGRDKHENEDLIRWGWPEDLWFHVDAMSSAHVYVRLPKGKGMDDLTPEMIEECCQLVKQNSIQGCKEDHVKVVYTPWSNLKKTGMMEVGQVGFHDEKLRRYHTVEKKNNATINRLEKTRVEKNEVDFRALREERDAEEARRLKREKVQREEEERQKRAEQQQQKELKSYSALNDETKMRTNQDFVPDEDDFM